jgi:TPP-dependent pyruvate/acetoin dehydrogenase alpha subunit
MMGLQRQGRVGFYGPATGHEAVNVGAGLATNREDWIFPGLREQLIALVRGHPLRAYMSHLFATNRDPARGRQMPCHPTAREVNYVSMSSVVGTQISHAAGLAYALKFKHVSAAAVAFFGDGATSTNDFHAGLNFAGVFRLPVVFCCANNQWAISQPVERQSHVSELATKGVAYGIPNLRVDGTDVIQVLAKVREAAVIAKNQQGPTLLEFVVYRMTPHSTSDDPRRYQTAEWAARASAYDPVARLELYLTGNGLLTQEERQMVLRDVDEEIRGAIHGAESVEPPTPDSLTTDVFGSSPAAPPKFGSR